MILTDLKKEMENLANEKQATILRRFFKTGPGDYGEGDIFLGIKIPIQRKLSNKFITLELSEIEELLGSEIHEHRMTALFILIKQYQKSDNAGRKKYSICI